VEATNGYTADKIECEALIRDSGLTWCILRLADVPVLGPRRPHPIMYAESQRLLRYQRHSAQDIAVDVAAGLGWRRRLLPVAAPLARAAMLRLSPYYRTSAR